MTVTLIFSVTLLLLLRTHSGPGRRRIIPGWSCLMSIRRPLRISGSLSSPSTWASGRGRTSRTMCTGGGTASGWRTWEKPLCSSERETGGFSPCQEHWRLFVVVVWLVRSQCYPGTSQPSSTALMCLCRLLVVTCGAPSGWRGRMAMPLIAEYLLSHWRASRRILTILRLREIRNENLNNVVGRRFERPCILLACDLPLV